jgi:hypothetical protein
MTQAPPIHFTGNPTVDWFILVVAAVVALYALKAIRLSRDAVRPAVKLFLVGLLIGGGYHQLRGQAGGDYLIGDCLFFGFATAILLMPKRSRHIPAHIKKAVIARDFKGREHEYDPQKYDIDHKWAFARGGSHTIDNLRAMERGKNRRKGKKKPGLFDMFFR